MNPTEKSGVNRGRPIARTICSAVGQWVWIYCRPQWSASQTRIALHRGALELSTAFSAQLYCEQRYNGKFITRHILHATAFQSSQM